MDPEVILAESPIRTIRLYDELDSTNDKAKLIVAQDPDIQLPALVLANTQTKGRGRRGRKWWSGPGSLTFSVVIDANHQKNRGLISIASGLATANAVTNIHPHVQTGLKWPNDVFLDGKKVAGILIEQCTHNDQVMCIIGIGVNLNCDVAMAPKEFACSAASISQIAGNATNPKKFLCLLMELLCQYLARLDDGERLSGEFSEQSIFQTNGTIRVTRPNGEVISGTFAGIGSDGQLLIQTESTIVEVDSATVNEFEHR